MDLFDMDEVIAENENAVSAKKIARIRELEALILKYQDSYYNGEAEVSDAEFDALWDELKKTDPVNPVLHKVGADSGNFLKAPHIMPMGSQEKAADPEEFLAWAKDHDYDEYLVEYKLDGASLELQYANGKLLRAVTRGNGSIGDVITENAVKMQGVRSEIFSEEGKLIDFTGGIRGEVIMTHRIHETLFSDKANCRNAANGLMKRKDGEGSENLTFIAYDVWASEGKQPFEDEEGKILFLKKALFNSVPLKICTSADEVIKFREKVMETRKNLDYDIDGLVIKERSVNHEDASRDRPDRQIAFKFSLEEAVSVLRKVEWNETGATYTPVAVFDPVSLNGTTVQRASLVNTNTINALNLKIGSRVVVVKRGEIIPKVVSVVESEEGDVLEDIAVPEVCSCCGSRLVDEGTRLFCPGKDCRKKNLHKIQKWVSVLDIRDFGDTLIKSLFEKNVISNIHDIYSLDEEKLAPFFLNEDSLKDDKKSRGAEKVTKSIFGRTKISLSKFIAGFDIEGIGEVIVDKLVQEGYDTFDKLLDLKQEQIENIHGFAETLAKTFIEGIAENRDEMKRLVDGKIITLEEGSSEGKLTGLSFCFTGELHSMKRTDAQNLVKELKGTVKSSVVKGLSYLVTNDTSSGSAKNKKAAELGVPIINEEQFLALVKG